MARLITQSPLDTRLANWLETAWLQRYLERRLDPEEAAWFEAYAMDKPALLERLELDTELRDGLAVATGSDSVVAMSQPTDSDPEARRLQASQRRRRSAINTLALAASLLVGVGVGWFSRHPAPTDDAAAIIASPMRIVFDTERGSATAPRIEHAGSVSPWMLVEIAVPPGATDIGIQMENGGQQSLVASAEGFVSFLARNNARDGDRMLQLSYLLDGKAQSRSFKLEAKGGAQWNDTGGSLH